MAVFRVVNFGSAGTYCEVNGAGLFGRLMSTAIAFAPRKAGSWSAVPSHRLSKQPTFATSSPLYS